MIKRLIHSILIIISTAMLASCFSVQYPNQTKYLLHVNPPKSHTTFKNKKILQVLAPSIAPQFANTVFVYRTSDIHYQNDFYHVFFIPPSQQIQEILMQYLGNTSFIGQTIDSASPIRAHYMLHSKILALYADYRHRTHPKAIMTIQFTLLKYHQGKMYQLMHLTFSESAPLKQKDSESLVYGWSQDLQKILQKLSTQLRIAMR